MEIDGTAKPVCELLLEAYECGVDHGLLMAEQERDSEDMFDAAGCAVYAAKMNVPSSSTKRRVPHSNEWRKAKSESANKIFSLLIENQRRA